MPQTNKQDDTFIPVPLTSGALDQPDAPQSSVSANNPPLTPTPTSGVISGNVDDMFPLLSKSPGFKEAMSQADKSGPPDGATTLPPAMIMHRNLRILEDSELYKGASPRNRVLMQQAFYKKYVVPAQRAAKYKSTFDEWIQDRGAYWKYKVNPGSMDKPLGGLVPGLSSKKAVAEGAGAVTTGALRTNVEIAKTLEETKQKAIFEFKNISKTFSLGTAMLNAEIAPHMGPIIMNPEYREVRKTGFAQDIDRYMAVDDYYQKHGYRQSVANKMLRTGGELTGDVPVFIATDGVAGLTTEMLTDVPKAARLAKVLPMTGLQKVGTHAIGNYAQGYLIGALEGAKDPSKTAAGFGATSLVLGLGGWQVHKGLLSPAAKLFGSIFGWGGGKLATGLINQAATDVTNKAPHAGVSPVSVAMAGSQKQKISAAVISALNDMTGGNFTKAPEKEKRAALALLMRVAPEYAEQIAHIDKNVIGADSAKTIVAQRAVVPEYDEVLKKLEGTSKQPTHETMAETADTESKAQLMRRSSDRWVQELFKDPTIRADIEKDIAKYTGVERRAAKTVPGAASATSLEFGENLTKHVDTRLGAMGLGKDTIQFETRGDKLLFYLNVLQAELAHEGPSVERNREFQLLISKIQEDFPGDKGSLPNLLKMSDKIWSDMEQASQAGIFQEGETFRYWRQHSRPGESPFAHEVELLQQATKAESQRAADLETEMAAKVPKGETEEEKQNRLLKEAFAKSGDKGTGKIDTDIFTQVTERLFPGQKYADLTVEEQSEVGKLAGAISKGLKKTEKSGPGAASIKDPAFVGKKFGSFADHVNKIPSTFAGIHFETYRDLNQRQVMLETPKKQTEEMLKMYKEEPAFKDFADAARQYVHNNATIVDAARVVTGMKPKATFSNYIGQLDEHQAFVSRTKYIDGSFMEGPQTGNPKGTLMTMKEAQKYAENLYTSIREAQEVSNDKFRGMKFDTASSREMGLYLPFEGLKVGDKIDLPLSSFSADAHTASSFGGFGQFLDKNTKKVFVVLYGPHKGINLSPFNHYIEQEFVTGGQFEVVEKEIYENELVLHIKQTGTF